MIKNYLCYDLYDSDNGWGMGLGAKNLNDADVCTLAGILKEENEDDESVEKEEEKKEKKNNYNETEATDELLKKLTMNFSNIEFFYTFRLPPPVLIQINPPQKNLSNTMHRNIQASRKPSNLKKHLVKLSQNYFAKPCDSHSTFQEIYTLLQNA